MVRLFKSLLLFAFFVLLAACNTKSTSDIALQAVTNYYVSPDGNDSASGSLGNPWRTVTYAVSAGSPVKAGDIINVQPGTYTELITLAKSGTPGNPITLRGNGNLGEVILRDPDPKQGGFDGDGPEGIIQGTKNSNWVIKNLRIQDSSYAGIALQDARDITVQDNYITKTNTSGILFLSASFGIGGEAEVSSRNIKVLNNTLFNVQTGAFDQEALSLWGVDGFEVAFNKVEGGEREGIDAKVGSRNGSIHHNTVTQQAKTSAFATGGGPAIYIEGSRAESYNIDVYSNLVFANNADGIIIDDEETTARFGDVHDIRVYNNVVYNNGALGNNGGRGIGISNNVRDVEVSHNTFFGNVQAFAIGQDDFGGAVYGGYAPRNIRLYNNIFANSQFRNGYVSASSNVSFRNNLFTTAIPKFFDDLGNKQSFIFEDNRQVADPGFINAASGNFRLRAGSSAIDAGSREVGRADRDNNGAIRPQGNAPDIGAYESGGAAPQPNPQPTPPPNPQPNPTPQPGKSYRLTPSADRDNAASSGPNDTLLNASRWQTAYLKFDLSSITGEIVSAQLELKRLDSYLGNIDLTLSKSSSDAWLETDTVLPERSDVLSRRQVAPAATFKVDLTGFIQNEKGTNQLATILLNTNTDGWSQYASSESSTPPRLIIVTR